MRERNVFGVGTAMLLTACRAVKPIPIDPVLPDHKTGTAIESSVGSTETVRPASASAAHTSVCPPPPWRSVPNKTFGEQETWVFSVHWGGIRAGEAVLAVEGVEPIRKRPAYHISMEIKATGMVALIHPYSDRIDSWLDRDSLTTVLIRHSVRQPHYKVDETVELDPACRRFQKTKLRLHKNVTEVQEGPLPPETLDLNGALFYLRTLPLEVGRSFEWTLFTGEKAVSVSASIRQKKKIRVPAGVFDCVLIELATPDPEAAKKVRDIQWWISADDRHLPVRIRMDIALGHINADLERLPAASK